MNVQTYQQQATRQRPACVVFLVDQSTSMGEPFAGDSKRSKQIGTAEALNSMLLNLIIICDKDPGALPRHYYDVGVIGYGRSVGSAFGGALAGRDLVSIPELAMNPIDRNEPKWVETLADGPTPMGEAFNKAGQILAPWVKQHADSFPPIVINITDGVATDEPQLWANRLRTLSTSDGSLLLYNLNISRHPLQPVLYPQTAEQIETSFGKELFEMTSPLTERMCQLAGARTGSRGFGLNADFESLISFLQTGTQVGGLPDAPTVPRAERADRPEQ